MGFACDEPCSGMASLKEAAGWQTYALEYQYYRTSYISVWVCNVPTYMQTHNSEKQFIWKCPGIFDFGYWNMGTYQGQEGRPGPTTPSGLALGPGQRGPRSPQVGQGRVGSGQWP